MQQQKIFILVALLITSCSQNKSDTNESGQQDSQPVKELKIEAVEKFESEEPASWRNPRVEKIAVKGYYPKFADKHTLLYSTKNYEGLWIFSMADGSTTQISDKRGAGYKPAIINDTIIYQVQSRRKSLEKAILSNREVIEQINSNLDPQRYLDKQYAGKSTYATVADDLLSIKIIAPDKTYELSPNGKKNYLNAALSPNGQQLLYEVSGGEAHIANLKGDIKRSLGEVDAPKWVGNDQVLFTVKKDDGMQTISSKIYVQDFENDTTFLLTDLNMIENPSINDAGNIIVANTPDGGIYLITKNK